MNKLEWAETNGVLVSNYGNVKIGDKELKQYDCGGYRTVSICNKTASVHRLVATAFIPNPDNKPVVNHKDGNKSNNCVSNLEWVTVKENARHSRHVLRHAKRHVTYREYLKQLRISKNMTMQDVADAFGMTRQYYEMIESGDRQKKMDFSLVTKISDLFGISMEKIAEYEQEITSRREEQ